MRSALAGRIPPRAISAAAPLPHVPTLPFTNRAKPHGRICSATSKRDVWEREQDRQTRRKGRPRPLRRVVIHQFGRFGFGRATRFMSPQTRRRGRSTGRSPAVNLALSTRSFCGLATLPACRLQNHWLSFGAMASGAPRFGLKREHGRATWQRPISILTATRG
jgi:hypothetical protein